MMAAATATAMCDELRGTIQVWPLIWRVCYSSCGLHICCRAVFRRLILWLMPSSLLIPSVRRQAIASSSTLTASSRSWAVGAHYYFDDASFSGLVFPTFRRVVGRTSTGSLISGPLAVLLVISDIVVVSTNLWLSRNSRHSAELGRVHDGWHTHCHQRPSSRHGTAPAPGRQRVVVADRVRLTGSVRDD